MYQNYKWTSVSDHRNKFLKNYEPLQPYIFVELANRVKPTLFVDVGANIGSYSLFMLSVSSIKEIYSFEPSPLTFRELVRNINENDPSKKIKFYQNIISNSQKMVEFGIVEDYSGSNSVVSTSIHDSDSYNSKLFLDAVILDKFINVRGGVVCMKIDVEGHEFEVIEGARSFLKNNSAIIQIEIYDPTNKDIFKFLAELGYNNLFHIGPDFYFSNIKNIFNESDIINVFECCLKRLIEDNIEGIKRQNISKSSLRLSIFPNLSLEISGKACDYLRAAKRRILSLF